MTGICKKLFVCCICYLGMVQVQAQVNPRHNPVTPNNTQMAPRPIWRPNRPADQVMPSQRNYSWYVNQLRKRQGLPANTIARKPTAIANPSQMPASRNFAWWQQQLAKRNPEIMQRPQAGASRPANLVMPAQRSYQWWQQRLDESRKRAHLEPLPGIRD